MRKRGMIKSVAIFELSLMLAAIFAFSYLIAEIPYAGAVPSANNIPSGSSGGYSDTETGVTYDRAGTPIARNFGSEVRNPNTGEWESATAQPGTTPAPDSPGLGIEQFFTKLLGGGIGTELGIGNLLAGFSWGVIVGGAIYLVGSFLGVEQEATKALSAAAFAGFTAGGAISDLVTNGWLGTGGKFLGLNANAAGIIGGVVVAAVVFALLYKKESKKIVELQCLPWEAPLGGRDCEKCNQDPFKPCSEYRCKSLGQACELVNKGSVEERCTWVSKGDVSSPVIEVRNDVLTAGHQYSPDSAIRPPARGVKIIDKRKGDGCIQPFTPLQFGIKLNEPGQCKIDIENGNKSFDEMTYYFGESNLYRYNHTEKLRLPSPDSVNAESPEIPNEGRYNFYVRCRDVNGNVNEDVFVFNLCVDKSPDATAPVIESTSIISGSAVQFGTQNLSLTLNVNEPAECRWSAQDKNYDIMENNFTCSTHVYEQNAQQVYPCTGNLNGIKDRSDNTFYFRCRDQPQKQANERNTNQESYRFSLKGTQPLNIVRVEPNSTFTGSSAAVSVNLTVVTDDGAEEGKSTCYFSDSGRQGSFISMFSTNSFRHEQVLSLSAGSYSYYFRCVDSGGNAASANTSFAVDIDRAAPQITRAYKEGPDALKIVTNEPAFCAYSLTSCNFVLSEGLRTTIPNARNRAIHAIKWAPGQPYYIKCSDDYGNEPSPNSCSLVVSASNAVS